MTAIEQAKAVVAAHEELVREGDLDGMLENFAEDVVVLAADAPLVVGKGSVRDLYTNLMAMGIWEFGHDYLGAEEVGNLVILHGVARGTLTPPDGGGSSVSNNFLHVFKRDADGRWRIWRAAFAPSGEALR